jgi:hypothetical protein
MFVSAEKIVAEASKVKKEIEKFTNGKVVKEFEDQKDLLNLLYIIPALFFLAFLMFTCFWAIDAACVCCGGSIPGCVAMIGYLLLWFLFFIISLVIVIAGLAFRDAVDKEKIKDVNGEPTIKVFVDHVEKQYPEFYDLVLKKLIEELDKFDFDFQICFLICVIIGIYSICVCVLRPYTSREHDESKKGAPAQTIGATGV